MSSITASVDSSACLSDRMELHANIDQFATREHGQSCVHMALPVGLIEA